MTIGVRDNWRMCFKDGADDVEEDAHAHGRDEKGSFSSQCFNTKEDKNGGRHYFHHPCWKSMG